MTASPFSSAAAFCVVFACVVSTTATAQPTTGGVVRLASVGEPPTFDCAAMTSATQLQYVAPHYSTLLAFEPGKYPNIAGNLAKNWSISPDGLRYSLTLHSNVKFHDGTTLTAEDVKATYERMANPPAGASSVRKSSFSMLKAVEVNAPDTIDFVLSQPTSSFLSLLASPWSCVYSAKKLRDDPSYPAKTVMGTGPFVFGDYTPGAVWRGKKFDQYFQKGLPYLDGFELTIMSAPAIVNAVASKQVEGNIRLISEPEKKRISDARGNDVYFQEVPSTSISLLQINVRRKPLDDARVRRALSLAIDREAGLKAVGIYSQKGKNVIFREGHAAELKPDQIAKYPGYSNNITAQRNEAKRLLEEAGVKDLKIALLAPNIKVPFEPIAIFLIDQWRQIGVTVTLNQQPIANQIGRMVAGDFDIAQDFSAPTTDDITDVLRKVVPGEDGNHTGFVDSELVSLFRKQDGVPNEAERIKIAHQFINRLAETQHMLTLFGTTREIVLDQKVQGWSVPPSYAVDLDLKTMWMRK